MSSVINVHNSQRKELIAAITQLSDSYGTEICIKVEDNSKTLLLWLDYLAKYHKTGVADELIESVPSLLLETAACLSIGFIRQAIFSLRTQIDLVLSWVYFKDHLVEWNLINETGDGYKMKKDLFDYFSKNYKQFSNRHGELNKVATRKVNDVYRLLSAHIHGQSTYVLPLHQELKQVVGKKELCDEGVQLVYDVSEYINDILISIFTDHWKSLPKDIRDSTMNRFLSKAQKESFFKS